MRREKVDVRREKAEVKSEKPITIWEKYNNKNHRYEHNHIEDGHIDDGQPKPKSKEQKRAWHVSSWKKYFGYLKDGQVVKERMVSTSGTTYLFDLKIYPNNQ